MTDVMLYLDYKSPYSYLVKDPAHELEQDYDVTVVWRPFVIDLPEFYGAMGERSEAQWRKVRYSYMDVRRIANTRGLTTRGPQKVFDSRLAGIGMLFAQKHGVFRAYNDWVFLRFWKRELDIEDLAVVTAVLAEAGAPAAEFAAYAESEGRDALAASNHEGEEAGVFGVPTFVLEGELFWGGDRIPMMRERLDEMGLAKAG